MIKKLRLRLTLLYSVIIGLILIAVIAGIAFYNRQESKKKELEYFQGNLLLMTSRLQSDVAIPHNWLAQFEYENHLIINVMDNQVPFRFQGSWTPPTERRLLIERLEQNAAAEHVFPDTKPVSSSLIKSSVFRIDGDYGDSYYGILVLMKTRTSFITLNLLSYIHPQSLIQWNEGILYLSIYFIGQLAVIGISWVFVGRSMKPVEEATKKQHEFIAAASHELRSPLAVIQAGLSSLSLGDDDKKTAAVMDKECRRMSGLIGDMLLLAASDARTWPLQNELLDVDTLLIECYEAFQPLAREKDQQLQLELPEDMLPQILGDRQRIEQILTILIDNALSYTPTGKQIRISACARDNRLIIDIEDQGPGIRESDRVRIFDRFYRAEHSRNDKKHFGLGLSIAKELTELLNARLIVSDSSLGGARFSLQLRIKKRS